MASKANREDAGSLQLPAILDLPAAAPLTEALLARRGRQLALDATEVQRVGALCVQVLLSAAATWRADGIALSLVGPPPALHDALRLLGLDLADLTVADADLRA